MPTSIFITRVLIMVLLTGIVSEYVLTLYKKPIKILGFSLTLYQIGTVLMTSLSIWVCNYETV